MVVSSLVQTPPYYHASIGVLRYRTGAVVPTKHNDLPSALATATAGDVILLGSGTWTGGEIPAGVIVRGNSAPRSVIITGATSSSNVITLNDGSTIRDVLLVGPDDDGAACVLFAGGAGTSAIVIDISLAGTGGAGAAIRNTGAGRLLCRDINMLSGTYTEIFDAQAGNVVVESSNILAGDVTDIFKVTGGALLDARNILVKTTGTVTNGLTLTGSGSNAKLTLVSFDEIPTNALHLTGDGVSLECRACDLRGSTWDLLADSGLTGTGTTVTINASLGRGEALSAPTAWYSNATVTAVFEDPGNNEDRTLRVLGELAVGSPNLPREAAFGEGDSTVASMLVQTFDGTATYADVTEEAASAAGSTFTMFSALTSGAICYLGNTDRKFGGFKTDLTVAGVWSAPSLLAWEYWDGTAWTSFNIMATQGETSYADDALKYSGHTYFDDRILSDWATTSVNGTTAYWARIRLTGSITTSPVCERVKLHTNRFEVNENGRNQLFGTAEPDRVWWEGTGSSLSTPSGGVNGPNTFDLSISSNVTYRQENASCPNGSDVRRAGTMVPVPVGLDTSKQITFAVIFTTNGTDANPVRWDLYTAQVEEGDVIGSLTEVLTTNATLPSQAGSSGQTYEVEFDVDIETLKPGGFLSFMLFRKGATDSNGDTANVMSMRWRGKFWLG